MLHSYFVPLLSASMFNLSAESTEKPFLAQWFCCAGRDRTGFPEPGELSESFGAGIWQLLCSLSSRNSSWHHTGEQEHGSHRIID